MKKEKNDITLNISKNFTIFDHWLDLIEAHN